jgi:3-(3-hydroxy-phenyl)propionate hydroxylase/flavoprotein hydroxylase
MALDDTPEYDVAVVGFGPIGMATAILLGAAGHRVVVMERYDGLYNLPRAAIFDDETMRTFVKLGVADELLPKVHAQPRYEWVNGDGELLIEHEFALVGRSGWGEWYEMYQPDLEDAMVNACAATGNVDVRFGTTVRGYEQDADGVTVLSGDDGRTRVRYVVACDGGNGFSRAAIGATLRDYGFSEPWMVCDFRLRHPVDIPMARQVCDPRQPISIISLGPTYHRFSFMIDSVEQFQRESAPERVWDRVSAYLGPDDAELIRVATYTFRSLVVDHWRDGRVLLAGDSAHQMPPFLGQGMCSGLRDAHNLAFKLDLVLRGRAGEDLLDTYQTEREPQVEAVIRRGIELGRVQTMRDPVAAAERDARLLADRKASRKPAKIRFPGLGDGFLAEGDPAAGTLFPQDAVTDDGRLFDDVHGYGWMLVATRSDILTDDVRTRASWLDGVVVVPDTGFYAEWFAEHGATAAIVRPDFYVYGAAADAPGLVGLLDDLTARVSPALAAEESR